MISCGAKEDSLQEVKDVDQVKKDQKKNTVFYQHHGQRTDILPMKILKVTSWGSDMLCKVVPQFWIANLVYQQIILND